MFTVSNTRSPSRIRNVLHAGLTSFCDLLEHRTIEHRIRQQLRQPHFLVRKRLQAACLRHVQPAILGLPRGSIGLLILCLLHTSATVVLASCLRWIAVTCSWTDQLRFTTFPSRQKYEIADWISFNKARQTDRCNRILLGLTPLCKLYIEPTICFKRTA